jgi:hypothetical protein
MARKTTKDREVSFGKSILVSALLILSSIAEHHMRFRSCLEVLMASGPVSLSVGCEAYPNLFGLALFHTAHMAWNFTKLSTSRLAQCHRKFPANTMA